MEKEVVECALKRSGKDRSIATVLSTEECPAVGKFQNFLSTVTRVTLKVVLKNGRVTKRSIVFKDSQAEYFEVSLFQKKYDVFKIETMMYLTVLKEMEWLMEEFDDTDGIMWCRLIHHVPYTCMVMEDLKVYGFSLVERNTYFSEDESLMAVNCLGRYHGLSKVMEERGVIDKHAFKSWFISTETEMHDFWYILYIKMIQGVKMHWGPNWSSLVDRMDLTEDGLKEKLKTLGTVNETKFNVLNHGDCHKNNIMFRHDWQGRPVEMKFLDFQVPHYGSPCCDLTYLMYLGVAPTVRRENYHLLLEVYHQSLTRTLDRYQFNGKKPDLQDICDGMERLSFVGLIMFLFGFPSILIDDFDKYMDFQKITESKGKEGIDMDLYKRESFKQLTSPDLEVFINNFF